MAFRSQEEVEVLKLNRLCAQDGTSRARPCMKISDSDFASKSVFTPEADYKYERRNVKVKHETWTGTSTQRTWAPGCTAQPWNSVQSVLLCQEFCR